MQDGVAAYSSDVGAGWGGEAFGKELGAMTIEGNWITGAMSADFPDVDYPVRPAAAGPGRPGHPRSSPTAGASPPTATTRGARRRWSSTSPRAEQQMAFADAFGVMPSRRGGRRAYQQEHPELAPFIDGADYAQNLPRGRVRPT